MFSHTTNRILIRDEVGKTKPSSYDLPTKRHVYGFKPKSQNINMKDSKLISFLKQIRISKNED